LGEADGKGLGRCPRARHDPHGYYPPPPPTPRQQDGTFPGTAFSPYAIPAAQVEAFVGELRARGLGASADAAVASAELHRAARAAAAATEGGGA